MSQRTQPVSRDWRERRARYLARTGRAAYPAAAPLKPRTRKRGEATTKPAERVTNPAPDLLPPCWICQSTGQCRHRELGLVPVLIYPRRNP